MTVCHELVVGPVGVLTISYYSGSIVGAPNVWKLPYIMYYVPYTI